MKYFYRFIYIMLILTVQGLVSCQKNDNSTPDTPPQTEPSHGSLKGTSGSCLGSTVDGKYYVDTALSASHNINVIVNVSIPGSYTISTDTVNGIFFSTSGVFKNVGTDTVKLKGKGMPQRSGSHTLKVNYDGTFCTVAVDVMKLYDPLNTLYIGGGHDKVLYAVDARNGDIKWAFMTGGLIPASPTVGGNTVFVGSEDNGLYAIDVTTGTLKWEYNINSFPYHGYIDRTPSFSNGTIYFNAANRKVYAIDTSTMIINGTIWPKFKWSTVVGDPGEGSNSPVTVGNGMVYQMEDIGYLSALDQSTGALKWRQSIDASDFNNVVLSGNVVYAFSDHSTLTALNATTGSILWQILAGGGGGRHMSSPTLSNGILYVGTSRLDFATNQIWAVNATNGTVKWISEPTEETGSISSGIIVANGLVYAASTNGYVYAWDVNTGAPKWAYNIGATIYGGVTVASDILYVGVSNGYIYALNAINGTMKWNKKVSSTFLYSNICTVDGTGTVHHSGESGEVN